MSSSDSPATAPADAIAHAETRKLERTMKPAWVFAIALGSAVGWGAFILPVEWLADGGTAGALIGFAIGTVLMAIIAVSYGLVIRALPVTGGELSFTLHAFGRYASFVVGWFLALAYACIIALNASAMTLVFRQLFPSLMERGYLYSIAGWDIHAPGGGGGRSDPDRLSVPVLRPLGAAVDRGHDLRGRDRGLLRHLPGGVQDR